MTIPLTIALLTYNRAQYLKESLQAIIDQTYRDFELLVLDNGSTDDTPHVVLSFKDERLRYVRNPPGYTAMFNFLSAVRIARGDRILVTHDDDIMEPDMLERQMATIKIRPDITAIWTNASVIDEQGRTLQSSISPPGNDRIYEIGEYISSTTEAILWHPPSSMIFSHRLLSEKHLRNMYIGSPGLSRRRATDEGDQILPAQMNISGAVVFLSNPLLRYRRHTGQETTNAHLAKTALNLFRALLRIARKTPHAQEHEPIFQNQIIRFQAQDLVMNAKGKIPSQAILKRLNILLEKGISNAQSNPRALCYLLPLIVLLLQTKTGNAASVALNHIETSHTQTRQWMLALHRWAEYRRNGGNIFSKIPQGSRVAILGSVFIAAILLIEAKEAGVSIVCCLDSNTRRQGQTWFGVPIFSHSWLATRDTSIDFILLSSERDSEDELERTLRLHDATIPVASWKKIATEAGNTTR